MGKYKKVTLVPVMLCFLVMGFVDLVGIASNYVQKDLNLTDGVANIFPSLVFFWFLVFSVPTGVLMNKIGRKKTVLVALYVTVAALALPLFGNNFWIMFIAFSLLGIGNTMIQTSLNPLVSSIIGGDHVASILTFGQFLKSIASFMAPYLAMWGASAIIPSFGFGWRVLFLIYFAIAVVITLLLLISPVRNEIDEDKQSLSVTHLLKLCFGLLRNPLILLSFIAIMCQGGIDIGTNTTAPKLLMERLNMSLNAAAFATSLYFIFRMIGCLSGSFFLRKMKHRVFFLISVTLIALGMAGMFVEATKAVLYVSIALVGFGNANIFSIVYSQAHDSVPENQKNEVSALMIMGLFGGAVFPLLMGVFSDSYGQAGAVAVMAIGFLYLYTYTGRIKG